MIFVIEHEKNGVLQCEIVEGVEDLDTSSYQPVKKIFLCETQEEANAVMHELSDERFKQ